MSTINIIDGNNDEFYLENVINKNLQYPRTFLIPTKEEISNLEIGNSVKLIFVMKEPNENGCRAEKMWVKITDIQGELFTATLDNDPYYLKSVKFGELIKFKSENIASTYGSKALFNEKLYAIVTRKALDERQINWVVRTDDLCNDQDSGWQLFYGDESDEYLDDPDNASIVSLEYILSFEPLLENVFSESGYSYEYSKSENSFIEVS